jgi:hypothetical protein
MFIVLLAPFWVALMLFFGLGLVRAAVSPPADPDRFVRICETAMALAVAAVALAVVAAIHFGAE